MSSLHTVTADQLRREYVARLEEIPPMEQLLARRPRTLDEAIERTRLIGERAAITKLLEAQETAPERG